MSDSQYAVIYDLHSHTTASDGRLTPQELVHRAHEMRVGTLAITDHDTTAAIAPAREEISRSGLALNLIPGVEISTVWENHEIHIVGLNIDITHPLMCEFLAQQTERRNQRAQLIAERLEKAQMFKSEVVFPVRTILLAASSPMLLYIAQAASMMGIARAAPLPSPKRISILR